MKKVLVGFIILALATSVSAEVIAGPESPSLVSLQLTTVMDLPLDESFLVFDVGAGLLAGVEYRLPFAPWLYVRGALGFHSEAASLIPVSVSVFSATVGVGLRVDLLSWLSVTMGVSGGGFGCRLDDPAASGGNAIVSADAGLMLLPSPWRLTLGASYRYLLNFYRGLSATLGLSYELPPARTRPG